MVFANLHQFQNRNRFAHDRLVHIVSQKIFSDKIGFSCHHLSLLEKIDFEEFLKLDHAWKLSALLLLNGIVYFQSRSATEREPRNRTSRQDSGILATVLHSASETPEFP